MRFFKKDVWKRQISEDFYNIDKLNSFVSKVQRTVIIYPAWFRRSYIYFLKVRLSKSIIKDTP